jgi:hypothetical protein
MKVFPGIGIGDIRFGMVEKEVIKYWVDLIKLMKASMLKALVIGIESFGIPLEI